MIARRAVAADSVQAGSCSFATKSCIHTARAYSRATERPLAVALLAARAWPAKVQCGGSVRPDGLTTEPPGVHDSAAAAAITLSDLLMLSGGVGAAATSLSDLLMPSGGVGAWAASGDLLRRAGDRDLRRCLSAAFALESSRSRARAMSSTSRNCSCNARISECDWPETGGVRARELRVGAGSWRSQHQDLEACATPAPTRHRASS